MPHLKPSEWFAKPMFCNLMAFTKSTRSTKTTKTIQTATHKGVGCWIREEHSMDRYRCRPEVFDGLWEPLVHTNFPFDLVFREIRMDQWPSKSIKSFPRDLYWSMDGSSQWITGNDGNHGHDENHWNPGCKQRDTPKNGFLPSKYLLESCFSEPLLRTHLLKTIPSLNETQCKSHLPRTLFLKPSREHSREPSKNPS